MAKSVWGRTVQNDRLRLEIVESGVWRLGEPAETRRRSGRWCATRLDREVIHPARWMNRWADSARQTRGSQSGRSWPAPTRRNFKTEPKSKSLDSTSPGHRECLLPRNRIRRSTDGKGRSPGPDLDEGRGGSQGENDSAGASHL